MDGYIVDTIANFVSVKAFGKTDREAKYIFGRRNTVITAANKSHARDIIFWGVMSLFVRWIIWPSTIILNVYLFTHHRLSVAQITTFLSAIVLFTQFIWEDYLECITTDDTSGAYRRGLSIPVWRS